uniref:receptor protein-tyrosine kinase n=1 Tax=Erpetoichthys calabaricus TaxID=27687 RepID=A0A8C4XCN2_ERPCA
MYRWILVVVSVHCTVQGLNVPVIEPSSSDITVDVHGELKLSCKGDDNVIWVPKSRRFKKFVRKEGKSSVFQIQAAVEMTGTYTCTYEGAKDLNASIYVYVKDPTQFFYIDTYAYHKLEQEGASVLLPCILTDPSIVDVSLKMANGSEPPRGMNYTFDSKRGITIQNAQPHFSGDYVCYGRKGEDWKYSRAFSFNIYPKLRHPPYVSLERTTHVRIVGESFNISCTTFNLNFNYNVTWKYPASKTFLVDEESKFKDTHLFIKSRLSIPSVTMEDTGNITCIGKNEAGVNSTSTFLQVVEKAYLNFFNPQNTTYEVREGDNLELKVLYEAYPPVHKTKWDTPSSHNDSAHKEVFHSFNNRYETTLSLSRIKPTEKGQYTFFASNEKVCSSVNFHIELYQKPTVSLTTVNSSILVCKASGYPAPNIKWFICSSEEERCTQNTTDISEQLSAVVYVSEKLLYENVDVESTVIMPEFNKRKTMECFASNLAGEGYATHLTPLTLRNISIKNELFTPSISASVSVAAVFFILLLFLLYKYKKKPKYEIRWKIIEATDGNNYTFIDPCQLPYSEKWEFPRDKLRLGKILGAGAFGKVVEATAFGLGQNESVKVAVKMLKPTAHSDEKEALMSELKILSHLGHHKNIVNLLGACTHGGPVLVITEYCSYGDLLNFLRQKSENFLTCIRNGIVMQENNDYQNLTIDKKYLRSDSGVSSSCSVGYQEMKPVNSANNSAQGSTCDYIEDDCWPLDMDDLLRFAYQVAQGMHFLASRNCIHRDVAARNVLLTEGHVAKICDFGLARDIMHDANYVVKGNARLPVKWMSPESIFDCVYTVQSDVWSYGILLWEIFSLGKSPYPNMLVDSKFYKMVKDGYQMERPDFAPPEMYSIMKMCWDLEPTKRPTFSKIGQLIERLLGEETEQMNGNIHKPAMEENLGLGGDPECCEESCELVEETQPLTKTNNYQFC